MLSTAQVKMNDKISIKWSVAAALPPSDGQAKSLGFAGPVNGVTDGVFMVAGGANFPNGMPWDGGKKYYSNEVFVLEKKGKKFVWNQHAKYTLPEPIAYCGSTSTEKGIVYAGGENEKGISIGLVVNARGGSSIKEWKKGTPYYADMIKRISDAQKQGELKGILWHQGETDEKDAAYLEKLKEFIADLRADLNMPNIPFVAGEVNNVPLINEQVEKLPAEVPNTACVSSEGLTTMDRWHFDTKSMLELGKRYAEKMIELQKEAVKKE